MKNRQFEIVVERGIPIPNPSSYKNAISPFLRKMKVGDSFLLPAERRSSLSYVAKRNKIKLLSRKSEKPGFIRVWRIA